jgi:hypothetical protein
MSPGGEGFLIFAAIYVIGFLPMQRLSSRRATLISALLGIALVPIGLALLRYYPISLNDMARLIFILWMMLAGIAILLGSLVRFYMLGRGDLIHRDRQLITVVLGIALGILELALFRYSGSFLD